MCTIDLKIETPVPLQQATQHRLLQHLGNHGEPPDYTTVWKWATSGRRGVKLETVKMPRGMCTTEDAIIRFIERLSMPGANHATERTPSQTRRQHAAADAALAALGL